MYILHVSYIELYINTTFICISKTVQLKLKPLEIK